MSMPTDPKTPWPPTQPSGVDYPSWSAWYSGDVASLQTDAAPSYRNPLAFLFFWRRSEPKTQAALGSKPNALHMPLAADIAQTSADLLFGDPVDLQLPEASGKAQARLEEIVELSGLHNSLLETAETCAAMGGTFLRAMYDTELADWPFLSSVQPDQALPEFSHGYLRAVTFWREVERDGDKVIRHLERHAKGTVEHAVFIGTDKTLGARAANVKGYAATAMLEDQVTLPKGLDYDAWYVPNVRPNQRDRKSPLGRADIQGCEPFLDALDETYSSLMRDIRVGKARILVPSDSLEPATRLGGRGAGRAFDLDREVFTELDGLDPAGANPINVAQFQIRMADHLGTAVDLVEKITSKAGYSPQTFGLQIEGRAESGTALRIREQKTFRTLERKRRYWGPTVQAAARALLIIDREVFGTKLGGAKVDLTPALGWPKETGSPADTAQTLQLLRIAEAASTETMVRMLHDDWDEDAIQAEVAKIRAESGSVVPDPLA